MQDILNAPVDKEAERVVLGAILLEEDSYHVAADMLQESDFFIEQNRVVFRSMKGLVTEGVAIDFHTILAELKRRGDLDKAGGALAITSLTDGLPRAVNIKHYCATVRSMAVSRRLMEMGQHLHTKASQREDSPQELIEKMQGALNGVYARYQSDGLKPMADVVGRGFTELGERKASNGGYGVQTGFCDIDNILGGLKPKNLTILGARPSVGKTALAINIADNASAAGKKVAVFSLEMGDTQLYCRLLASQFRQSDEAKVSMGELVSGRFHRDKWGLITAASDALSKRKIWIDDAGFVGPDQIWARCKSLKSRDGLDLVIVDYLQLAAEAAPGKSLYEKTTYTSHYLKRIAKDLGVPVLALSQLSRKKEGGGDEFIEPQLSDLRESGAIEQDADEVMFLWKYMEPTTKTPVDGIRKGKIAKQRNGPLGDFDLGFDAAQTKFFSIHQGLCEA
jgi:replicative DNA helicase